MRWLPNQLMAVLEGMGDVGRVLGVREEGDDEADMGFHGVGKLEIGGKWLIGCKANDANGTANGTNGVDSGAHTEALKNRELQEARDIMAVVTKQKRELEREVSRWCQERGEKF